MESEQLPAEQAYVLRDKPCCPKHPSKTIEYFCKQDVCSDRLSCSSCILKKQYCRHQMNSIIDIPEFLFKQRKAMQMNGLSNEPDIFDFLAHREDRIELYTEGLRDELGRFKAELAEVVEKVVRVFRSLEAEIESQFEEYISSYMEQMLLKKINDSYYDTYLARFKSFEELVGQAQTGTLPGLKTLLQKLTFQTTSEAKLKEIRKTYQSIVSMEEQTPIIDYEKYEHIKSHFKLFESKLSQAGPTLITLRSKPEEHVEEVNPHAIVDKAPVIPITNIRKIAQSTHFPTGHSRTVFAIIRVKDRIITGSDDGTIRFFDAVTFEFVTSQTCHSSGIRALAQLPNGVVATGSYDKTVKLWNVEAFLGGGNLSLSSASTKWLPIKTLAGHTSSVISLQYMNDGINLASGSADYSIKIWNVQNGSNKNFSGHMNDVLCFACSSSGNILVSGSADRTIKTWSLSRKYSNTCLKTLTGHTDAIWSIVLLPDQNTLFSASLDKSIRMWNLSLGTCLKTTVGAHSSHITKVLYFAEGVLASCSQDGTIKMWDYRANIEVHSLSSKKSGITTMMAGDSGSIISLNQEKEAQVWD